MDWSALLIAVFLLVGLIWNIRSNNSVLKALHKAEMKREEE